MSILSPFLLLFAETAKSGGSGSSEHMVAIFFLEIVLMLALGRLLGEGMQRIGQPAVMGQLIAGVILGPSILGHLWPTAYEFVFPPDITQKKMIDAVSQLGILMLLLLTGMETDLKLVNKMRKTAFLTSASGIIVPFACGLLLGHFMPQDMLPDPQKRLVTALFLATALSISSVKIVAMVIMEVGFLRRNVGQIILASAILDDTIGWIIIAVIGGIAAGGTFDLGAAGFALLGTVLFLAFSFTIGRRIVAFLIRWTNDHLTIEMPVITVILVIMIVMSLITDAIGVHTVLGAFVVGILVGQSPILTKHIEEQLRGLIIGLFAPIFFAVAGREIDLTMMNTLEAWVIALLFILIASVGKVAGAFLGGRLSKLGIRESTALAIGMNARGSTEVIVATIGLSLGVLNHELFTLIVVMAICTTLVTPPLLRWALKRIPPTGEEKERLEAEEAEAGQVVPQLERLLVAADDSEDGRLASVLAGVFVGKQRILSTVIEFGKFDEDAKPEQLPGELVKNFAEQANKAVATDDTPTDALTILVEKKPDIGLVDGVLGDIEKGYDILFLGLDEILARRTNKDGEEVRSAAYILQEFTGVTAIALNKGRKKPWNAIKHPNILLPITGTDYSQRAAELAVALARGAEGKVTALHITPPLSEVDVLRRPKELAEAGRTVVARVQELGKHEKIRVKAMVKMRKSADDAILSQIIRGKHDLVILGVKARGGEKVLSFGRRIAVLVERSPVPILLVNS